MVTHKGDQPLERNWILTGHWRELEAVIAPLAQSINTTEHLGRACILLNSNQTSASLENLQIQT